MRIIAKKTLRDYWVKNPSCEFPLLDWYYTVQKSDWNNPNQVKQTFGNASIVANNRVVFNIKGNLHRLVTEIDYSFKIVFIIWIGSHKAYDLIDVTKIEYNG
jgi:mRNA interferase HigB